MSNDKYTCNEAGLTIEKSKHTQNGKDIWVVKLNKVVSRPEYEKIKEFISHQRGAYSRYLHAFIFYYNPYELFENIKSKDVLIKDIENEIKKLTKEKKDIEYQLSRHPSYFVKKKYYDYLENVNIGLKEQRQALKSLSGEFEDGGNIENEPADKSVLVEETVSRRLRQAQEKKEFKDVSIAQYTKKYKRSYDIVTVNTLDELEVDAVNAYKHVEKSKVWPEYDLQEQKEKGYSAGATYLKVKCRDALQSRPFDSRDARDVYVKNISKLIVMLDACFTVSETRRALKNFIEDKDFYYGEFKTEEKGHSYYATQNYKKFITIFGKRFYNFCYRRSEAAAEDYNTALLYEGFTKEQQDEYILKQLDSAAQRIEMVQQNYENVKENAENEAWLLTQLQGTYSGTGVNVKKEFEKDKEGFKKLFFKAYEAAIQRAIKEQENIKNREGLPESKIVREDNWNWAFGEKPATERKATTSQKVNTKLPLDHIVRVGGLEIPTVSVEQITKQFCFNNVVFGNALKDIESREHVKHFLGAISDLAEILDIDICAVNQLGKLDINFATMGVAGHMATYFPSYKAINLSKKSGDGSVAHEWFHYLDNVIAEGSLKRASSLHATEISVKGDYGVKQAIYQLKEYITHGDGSSPSVVHRFEAQDKVKYHAYGDTLEDCINYIQRNYRAYGTTAAIKNKQMSNYYGFLAHKFGKEYIDVSLKPSTTMFYYNSSLVGSSYWVEIAELTARAFEAYVEYILDLKDRKNNYLVSYKNNCTFYYPYPKDEELEKIVVLFDNVIKEFKKEFGIGDFVPFTDKRSSEFVEIEVPKEKKPQKDVETPASAPEIKEETQKEPEIMKQSEEKTTKPRQEGYKFAEGEEVAFMGTGNKLYFGHIAFLSNRGSYEVQYKKPNGKASVTKSDNELLPVGEPITDNMTDETGWVHYATKNDIFKPDTTFYKRRFFFETPAQLEEFFTEARGYGNYTALTDTSVALIITSSNDQYLNVINDLYDRIKSGKAPIDHDEMQIDNLVAQAFIRGKEAFAEGLKATPVHDPKLMELVNQISGPVGSSIPLLEAWSNGWHEANVAAPVPEPEPPAKTEVGYTETGLIKPEKIKLRIRTEKDTEKWLFFDNYEDANQKMRSLLNNARFSDLEYKIMFSDGEVLEGVIDCEPREFWYDKDKPLTWHITTFWGNMAKSNATYITREDKEFAQKIVNNYLLQEESEIKPKEKLGLDTDVIALINYLNEEHDPRKKAEMWNEGKYDEHGEKPLIASRSRAIKGTARTIWQLAIDKIPEIQRHGSPDKIMFDGTELLYVLRKAIREAGYEFIEPSQEPAEDTEKAKARARALAQIKILKLKQGK